MGFIAHIERQKIIFTCSVDNCAGQHDIKYLTTQLYQYDKPETQPTFGSQTWNFMASPLNYYIGIERAKQLSQLFNNIYHLVLHSKQTCMLFC